MMRIIRWPIVRNRSMTRMSVGTVTTVVTVLGLALPSVMVGAQAATSAKPATPATHKAAWVAPRTPDGHPDLQGNWSNGTMTPLERVPGVGRALTPAQVTAFEKIRADTI
jgi:hypothetical protein